jgi:hypothetical protein
MGYERRLKNEMVYMRAPVTVAERSDACTLSSLARKPGSWVRIPHYALMFVMCMCLLCVCVVPCLGRGLATS